MTDHITIHRALLKQALTALGSCTTGGYVDIDGDYQKTYHFSKSLVSSASQALRDELAKPWAHSCKWAFDDDESNTWASGCGELWSFIDGGPAENRVKYCHWCGKPVVLGDKQ